MTLTGWIITAIVAGVFLGIGIGVVLGLWAEHRRNREQWTVIRELSPDPELDDEIVRRHGTGEKFEARLSLVDTPHNDSITFDERGDR